jgi:hypothetical protein
MREAKIRQVKYYVVDLYEDRELVETRSVLGHSYDYAQDVSENWISGILQITTKEGAK